MPFQGYSGTSNSVEQAKFVVPRGYIPNGGDAWGKWWAAVNDLIYGKATSTADAMAQAEKETQELLDQAVSGTY